MLRGTARGGAMWSPVSVRTLDTTPEHPSEGNPDSSDRHARANTFPTQTWPKQLLRGHGSRRLLGLRWIVGHDKSEDSFAGGLRWRSTVLLQEPELQRLGMRYPGA